MNSLNLSQGLLCPFCMVWILWSVIKWPPWYLCFSFIYLRMLSKITTLTESSSLPMAEKIRKKTITLIDMTLSLWLQFWSGALMLPNNHVVLPSSIDSHSLLVTISHVLFCLQTPTSPVPCSWLFILLHWENQNSRRMISRLSPSYQFTYQHLHPYSLISAKLVQVNYSCFSLKPVSPLVNHPLLPTHGYHCRNSPQSLPHHQDFPLYLFILISIPTCYYFFCSKENFLDFLPLISLSPLQQKL